ncbi:sigma 54-interacting transcriptional regulator [Clostridium swellfunianum]|uniref:sigma-54-dependent Fis family transcriptional regulator n=1 Tax=Clostridium swellfunianum TaxID=1367462 RepID=UPI00202FAD9B|nr:sigma 54-interacting transcriptional regulator [Clostridium swellfunianum]MCM0650772.1 sigma 54-interacting transcriptional regulator [Clostridium swellfunianum]
MYSKNRHEEIIKKSHERCVEYGVEKERTLPKKILKGSEVSDNINNNKDLLRVAEPFMNLLYNFLEGSGFFIILTDKEGCILNLVGDGEVVKAARELNMVVGAYMDERSIGTNAMGTAIKEDSPIQISATEHFITAYHRWTCSAAPIHNEKGEIVGTLNLTGSSKLVHPHTLGLVAAAVKSIENQMKSDLIQSRLTEAYSYLNTIMGSISTGIFAVDNKGSIRLINKNACDMFGITEEQAIGKNITETFAEFKEIVRAFESKKSIQDEEISLTNGTKKERYNVNFYPINSVDKESIGTVVTLKEIQNVINLVNKYTGMRARYTFENIIGESRQIKKVIEYARQIANSPSTVLIQGESGTGKEVLAQAIHNESIRRDYGFVAINCGAIPKNLIESELFGYDDGAFTGARKGGHPGKFELANGGTLFLDEIGEMPLDMQVNLLRVLQEGTVTRVGGTKCIPVDVRIIAATNKDLKKEIEKGTFRQDLFYRLSVIPIELPPLRDRKEDIVFLVENFLKLKASKLKREIPEIDAQLYEKFLDYDWQGNIRELENVIENIVNLGGKLSSGISSRFVNTMKQEEQALEFIAGCIDEKEESYIYSLEELERKAILACMNKFRGNISHVAKTLGISRNTLYLKMKKYNI